MGEKQEAGSNVKSVIEAVEGIVKAVPVYEDAVRPAAKQIGKTLELVAKAVNAALSPVRILVWGYEQIESWLVPRVTDKLKNVSPDRIAPPPPNIAGPAVEALRYVGYDDTLRELYANLLASAIDMDTVKETHPAYVEVLKNLSSDEALLLQAFVNQGSYPAVHIRSMASDDSYFIAKRYHSHLDKVSSIEHADLLPAYFDNLIRLGILESPSKVTFIKKELYEPLESDPNLDLYLSQIVDNGRSVEFERVVVRLTNFGAHFVQRVVVQKS